MIQVVYVVTWWLALAAIGLVSFPLVSRVCGSLHDRGYAISRLVGLVILTYLAWIVSTLKILPFGLGSISVCFIILAALSLYFGRRNLRLSEWPWRAIVITESVFAVSFVGFLLILMAGPDIFYTGADYFMDCGFMTSIIRSDYFPPPDPWFAGQPLNYYYGGQLVVAILCVATRVPPTIGFNIAVAMYFSLSVIGSFCLGYNLTRQARYGVLAALFVCAVGYILGAYQFIGHLIHADVMSTSHMETPTLIEWLLTFDFWTAPWLIPGGMAQYPGYIFLMGTLHAFMMSIPFQLMFITLVFALFHKRRVYYQVTRVDTALEVLLLGLCLGFFYLVNAWELPTYTIFIIGVFALLGIKRSIKGTLAYLATVVALAFLLYLPLYLSLGMGGLAGIGLVDIRTPLKSFFDCVGLFLFCIFSLLIAMRSREAFGGWAKVVAAVVALAVIVAAAIILHIPLLIVVVPVGLVCLYYILSARDKTEKEFVLFLVGIGVALAFFCEVFYLDDALGGEWERFNTVMKLYTQMWVVFGIASAYAVWYVLGRVRGVLKVAWLVVLVAFVLASLVHPIASATSLSSGRQDSWGMKRGTLDGMAYVEMMDKGDYEAIGWMNRNISGSAVVLEAPGILFKYSSRISVFTGLPTVIGWSSWEVMWGRSWGDVFEREGDGNTIYQTLDNDQALALLSKYNVEYVYIGKVERERYPGSAGLDKFAAHPEDYQLVYEDYGVSIYRVMR